MGESLITCQEPSYSRPTKQVQTGRGHRIRLYRHKNCRMAAYRARQRAAEEEAERQRLHALELAEEEALRKRFGNLLPDSLDLLYRLKRSDSSLVEYVGRALQAERASTVSPRPKDLLQANIISRGHQIGFPAICEQGIDVPSDLAGWWHYTNYTPMEVLELFYRIVQRLYQEHVSKISA